MMFDNSYAQTLQDQIGQLSKLLGLQSGTQALESTAASSANKFDCVDGIEGARAFLGKMLSSSKHIVWDNNRDVFYVLQKDANGTPARIQICPYTIELEQTMEEQMEEKYVTKADFNALMQKLDGLLN